MNQEKVIKIFKWIALIFVIVLIYKLTIGVYFNKTIGDKEMKKRIEQERNAHTKSDLSKDEINLLEEEINITFPKNSKISIARIFEHRLELQLDGIDDMGYFLNECLEKSEQKFSDSELDKITSYLQGKGTPQFAVKYDNISTDAKNDLNGKQINNAMTVTYSFYNGGDYNSYTKDTVNIILYFDELSYKVIISKNFVYSESLRNVFE